MPNTRTCQISDEIFGGFQITVDIDYYYNTKELADYVAERLIASLKNIHLGQLVITANNKNFHIHDYDIYDLRKRKSTDIIYICAHC